MITSLIEMQELPKFRHMNTYAIYLIQVMKFCWWRHGQELWRHNLYFKMPFYLRRPRVANFTDIIKIATMFITETFKVSKES